MNVHGDDEQREGERALHKPNNARTQKSTCVTLTSPAGGGFCRVQIQQFTQGGKATS